MSQLTPAAPPSAMQLRAATTALTRDPDTALHSLPLLRDGWTPAHRLPMAYRREIDRQLLLLRPLCAPADETGIAVYAGKLAEWIGAYGLMPLPADPDEREAALQPVLVGFIDDRDPLMPGDLLAESVVRMRRRHRFRNLPMPAELAATVSADWARRRTILARLELAARIAPFEAPDIPAADRVGGDAMRSLTGSIASAFAVPPLYLRSDPRPPSDADKLRGLPPTIPMRGQRDAAGQRGTGAGHPESGTDSGRGMDGADLS